MKKACRIPGACGLIGIVDKQGKAIPGSQAIKALEPMRPRYNGLGAGFAVYGIYPKYRDCYALHVYFYSEKGVEEAEAILSNQLEIVRDEPIPIRGKLSLQPLKIHRYFVEAPADRPDDVVLNAVMKVNSEVDDAYIISSGKDMGVFKAIGYPDEVAKFFRIEEYEGSIWLGHGRYPTNTPGWWGGAHPFNVLGWSIIHNGEISSYGTNRRYIEQWGYRCTLLTDSEVLTYLLDLLVRQHQLPLELACIALSPPFWDAIEQAGGPARELYRAIRMTYASALVNGPFSIVAATTHGMRGLIGLTDRIKLRPLVAAEKGRLSYIASEECAIRAICPKPDRVWFLKAGTPYIARIEG